MEKRIILTMEEFDQIRALDEIPKGGPSFRIRRGDSWYFYEADEDKEKFTYYPIEIKKEVGS